MVLSKQLRPFPWFAIVLSYTSLLPSSFSATPTASASTTNNILKQQIKQSPFIQQSKLKEITLSNNRPSFLWLNSESLTPFDPYAIHSINIPQSITDQVQQLLSQLASFYKFTPEAIAAITVSRIHNTGEGAIVIELQQQFDNKFVVAKRMSLILNQKFQPIALSGMLASNAPVASKLFINENQALNIAYHNRMRTALNSVILPSWQENIATAKSIQETLGFKHYVLGDTKSFNSQNPARIRAVWELNSDNLLEPAWQVEMPTSDNTKMSLDSYLISAHGEIINKKTLTKNADFNYRVWAQTGNDHHPSQGPQGDDFFPHPTGVPDGTTIVLGSPSLIRLNSANFSRQDPWLANNATSTSGNNIMAYTDSVEPTGLTANSIDHLANTTSSTTFDYSYNFNIAPETSTSTQNAALVQAFYVTNFLHDWLYDSGFNEASGNGQVNNFGRGGSNGDPVYIEIQDFEKRNNAQMTVPSDGSSATMEVFLWDGPSIHQVEIIEPSNLTAVFETGAAQFGPNNFDIQNQLVLVEDGIVDTTLDDPSIHDGCEAFTNGAQMVGKIAVIDRGACFFVDKISRAEAAGAVGVIIINQKPDGVLNMGGGENPPVINIPSLMISKADGDPIRTELENQTFITANLFRQTDVDHDGALDNALLAHEWGHFVNNRLVNIGSGTQANGMDEGWSDFLALLFLVNESDIDNIDGAFPMSAFANSSKNSSYYGIRRMPYSSDMNKNVLTFKHIADGTPIENIENIAFGSDGLNNSEEHSTGEVWASMLWEGYVGLIKDPRHSFTHAQSLMKNYLIASLKATPDNPSFVEAKEALLAVVQASDAQDYQIFLEGFAKRGNGIGAIAPNKNTTTNVGVVESFANGHNSLIADAGADISATEGTTVELDGSSSVDQDGHITTVLWTQTAGMPVAIQNADQLIASFSAPEVTSIATLSFRLTITDDSGNTAADNLIVTINDNTPPPPPTPSSSGGGGGATMFWFLGLLLLRVLKVKSVSS